MDEDELRRYLEVAIARLGLAMSEPMHYWHFDEDFAAFMDHVLEPVDVD